MINKIFESEKYFGVRVFLITFVTLLILFNFVIIFNDGGELKNLKSVNGIAWTGMVSGIEKIDNVSLKNDSISFKENFPEKEVYSEQSYAFYYFILIIVGLLIIVLTVALILPRIKEYT